MATANSTTIERIQDFVGDEVTDIEGYKDLIVAGFNYVADLIPNTSELWMGTNFRETSSVSFADASDYKIIQVTSTDANSIKRICKEVPIEYMRRGEDTSSIYYNAGNYKNPIYSFDPEGTIIIKPEPSSFEIFYYTYITDTDITSLKDYSSVGFPHQAVFLAILKACSNLLQAKISQAVQEEEDNELLALLNGQMATVDKLTQEELQRLGLPFQLVGDGDDIK